MQQNHLLEENDTPHGDHESDYQQQDKTKLGKLPGEFKITLVTRDDIHPKRNGHRDQTQHQEYAQN